MRTLLTAILTICIFACQAQREFKNQGEQEAFWAEQIFKKEYTKQSYPRYTQPIVASGDSLKYANQILVVTNTSKKFIPIFSKGIFYPSVVSDADQITISVVEELPALNKPPMQKRFRFLLYSKWTLNPQVCFIELTNLNAAINTDLEAFIDGATLTFFKAAWIMI